MTDEPERVETTTRDLAAERLAALKELFPGAVADGVLDAARIGELADVPVAGLKDGRERYGLMWAGKQEAVTSLLRPSRGTLVPDLERSVDFENARNVFIEGDNLEVLKILQKAYNDQVKAIFIDPPYNSGSDFVYEDDYSDSLGKYLELTGQVSPDGQRLRAQTDLAGRRHSRWLSMMYPRLVLARNLLSSDGVIFITIDDRELHNLKLVLDEIFGEENFVSSMIWQSRTSISDDLEVSPNHNYVLVYSRDRDRLTFWGEPLREEEYANPDGDQRGPWKLVPLDANKPGGDTLYEVVNPDTGVGYWPPSGRSWAINPASMQALMADGRVKFGLRGDSAPKKKLFLQERLDRGDSRTPSSMLLDAGTTKDGTEEVREIFGGKGVFDYPKPTKLVNKLVRYATAGSKQAIVLDFFAGSGTTGHAVMQLNQADGGTRRFLLVQWPEETPESSPARKMGFSRLTDITLERIKRSAVAAGAVDFKIRVERLSESHFVRSQGDDLVAFAESTLRDPAASVGIAQEVFAREGVRLDRPWAIQSVDGAQRYSAGGVTVVTDLELTQQSVDAAIESNPRVLVFLEDAFAGKDDLKASAYFACKQAGLTMKTV